MTEILRSPVVDLGLLHETDVTVLQKYDLRNNVVDIQG